MKHVYDENTKCVGCGKPLPREADAASGHLCATCWLAFRGGGLVADDDPRFKEFEDEYNAFLFEEVD